MSEQLNRLGRQLEAITQARTIAQEEPDPDERRRLLAVVDRALNAAREEYEEAVRARPRFRLIKGGLAGAGIGAIATHTRKYPAATAAVGVAAAATAIGAVMLYGTGDVQPGAEHRPPTAAGPPSARSHPNLPRPPRSTQPPRHAAPTPSATTTPPSWLLPVSSTAPSAHASGPESPTLPTTPPATSPTGVPTPPASETPPTEPTTPITRPTSAPPGLCLNLDLLSLHGINVCL